MATLRMLHGSLVLAGAAAGVIAAIIPPGEAAVSPGLFAAIVLADAAVSLGMLLWARRRPLDTSSPAALASSYRSLYVMSLGVSFAPTMVGFIGAILTGRAWVGLLGVGFALAGLGYLAPRIDVARRQTEITASGSPLSLESALDARGE